MDIRKFDIRASKYFILTGLLCLLFLLLVSNAFRYLPSDDTQKKMENSYEQVQIDASLTEEEFVEDEIDEEDNEAQQDEFLKEEYKTSSSLPFKIIEDSEFE